MGQFDSTMQFDFDGPVYVSIDLDALDPAFAPGVHILNREDYL